LNSSGSFPVSNNKPTASRTSETIVRSIPANRFKSALKVKRGLNFNFFIARTVPNIHHLIPRFHHQVKHAAELIGRVRPHILTTLLLLSKLVLTNLIFLVKLPLLHDCWTVQHTLFHHHHS